MATFWWEWSIEGLDVPVSILRDVSILSQGEFPGLSLPEAIQLCEPCLVIIHARDLFDRLLSIFDLTRKG